MNEQFKYDVFLSHSSKDKPAVGELAERLRREGLRVWFDEWEILHGDLILLKIEEGLAPSRTLVLAMSRNAFASKWVELERHTAMFRLISLRVFLIVQTVFPEATISKKEMSGRLVFVFHTEPG